MQNCYKREDVFLCRHESHRRFEHRVSAYHVLREKQCYPDGCVSFAWKCKLLDKGGTCPKGYRHVGSNCTQCRLYDEEKIDRQPVLLLAPDVFQSFLDECRSFDDWLEGIRERPMEVGGQITDIRPYLTRRVDGSRTTLRLNGFLVRMRPAFVGRDRFEDAIYLRLSRSQQERLRLAPGDRIEAQGWMRLDRGRLVAMQPRRISVEEHGGGTPARWDQALLDRVGAVPLPDQAERCLRCERGVLVDVEQLDVAVATPGGPRRQLLCLEGIGRPAECPFEVLRQFREGVTAGRNFPGGPA